MLTNNDLVLLVLAASGGQISGKTLLQKRMYFVGIHINKDLGYKAHYYGPYSAEVNNSLTECVSLRFVDEKTSGFGIADRAGFEVRRFDYILSGEGNEVVEDLKKRYKQDFGAICDTLAVLEKSCQPNDYQDLSIAAKTMHIVREHGMDLDGYSVVDQAKKLGWKVSKSQVDQALLTVRKFNELEANTKEIAEASK